MSYKTYNFAMPTASAPSGVATANGLKTMLQIAAPSTRALEIVSWGYSVSVTPPGISTIELIQTDVAATVTAHVANGIITLDPNGTASLVTLGTSATGYTAVAEGTVAATRLFDINQLGAAAGNNDLSPDMQFMPDKERWIVAPGKFLRIRTTFTSTSPLFMCWAVWNEVG